MPAFNELIESIKFGRFEGDTLDLTPDICGQKLTDLEIVELATLLTTHPEIKMINLSYNSISDVGVEAIAAINTLEELDFSNILSGHDDSPNVVTARGAAALAKANLKKLTLHGNPIGDIGLPLLALNRTLLELDVSDSGVTNVSVEEFFSRNTSILSLNLACNQINGECLKGIHLNHVIQVLNLSDCFIDWVGTEFLSRNDSLLELWLANNNIGSVGAQALACHPRLNILNLSGCNLDDDAVLDFASNTSITDLCLSFNRITAKGVYPLCENQTLRILDITRNNIEFDDDLLKRVARMPSLIQICARNNHMKEGLNKKYFLNCFDEDTSIEMADFSVYCQSTQRTMMFQYSNKKRHNSQISGISEEQQRLASNFVKRIKL